MLKDDIKFVTPLNTGKHLLYIADTDYGDMGGFLAIKTIEPSGSADDGEVREIYKAEDDFKIDRYVISENQKWISWYEVKAANDKGYTHDSDYFRVFKANLEEVISGGDTLDPIKLYEQQASPNVQIALPSIITNSGSVYFDSLIASSYALYYGYKDEGMNIVLPLNSYNSNPYLIDQKYLLYTAFDPNNSKMPSTGDTDSSRDQIINTNIVKTYDLNSKEVETVAPGNEGEHYKHPVFVSGAPDGKISVVAEIYRIESDSGRQVFKFSEIQLITKDNGSFVKETIVGKTDKKIRILDVGRLPSGDKTVLIGEESDLRGNIGTGNGIGPSGYKNKLKTIKVYNLNTKALISTIKIDKSDDIEFVDVVAKLPQEKLGIQRNKKLVDELAISSKQLKLSYFVPVEPKRQRKNPRSECETEWEKKGYPNYEACEACPVYVYSNDKKRVSIKPVTPISENSAQPQLIDGKWNFTTDKSGVLGFEDGLYKKIDYDFPRGSVAMPSTGVMLSANELGRGIADYAYSLGFNSREVEDIVEFFSKQLGNSPYVFFSHLPSNETQKLLSLDISPQPETYISHIFYAKKLNSTQGLNIDKPIVNKINRKDYTVVVWGSVIE